MAREGQGYPCYQHDMMMMIIRDLRTWKTLKGIPQRNFIQYQKRSFRCASTNKNRIGINVLDAKRTISKKIMLHSLFISVLVTTFLTLILFVHTLFLSVY